MNREKIKFSVVIPAYNASKFLNYSLDSVRNQTYDNYEVLVTNNGSTDDTEKVLKNYKKKFPEFPLDFVSQENKGIGSSRNTGILRSIGEYIAFLDADDWWYPKKLEMVARLLCDNDIDVVYHDVIVIGREGKESITRFGVIRDPAYFDLLFNGNRVSTSTTVVRSSRIKEVEGFSEDLLFDSVEDHDLWLRLAKKNVKFYYLADVLGKYICHEDKESNKVKYQTEKSLNLLDYHLNMIKREGKFDKRYLNRKYMKRKSVILFGASRRFYYLKDYSKAVDYSIKAIRTDFGFCKPYLGLLLSYFRLKFT